MDSWNIMVAMAFSCFVWCQADKTDGAITGILGGIPDYGELELVPMGRWLFLFGFYFLSACRQLGKKRKLGIFTLYRYQSFHAWWKNCFGMTHMANLLVFLIGCAVWELAGLLSGKTGTHEIEIIVVFYLHLSVWISILIVSDIVFEKKIMPCILIIVEAVLYVFSVNYENPYLAGGMYLRCSYRENGIFSVAVYIIEIVIIVICYKIEPFLWKQGIWEGRKM